MNTNVYSKKKCVKCPTSQLFYASLQSGLHVCNLTCDGTIYS